MKGKGRGTQRKKARSYGRIGNMKEQHFCFSNSGSSVALDW